MKVNQATDVPVHSDRDVRPQPTRMSTAPPVLTPSTDTLEGSSNSGTEVESDFEAG
jgi:hypothetical protein